MSTRNCRGRFDFDYDHMLDEEVDTERILKPHPFEIERNRPLPFNPELLPGKIPGQDAFVYILTQSRAELASNTKRSPNDDTGNLIEILHGSSEDGQRMSAKSAKSAKSAAFKNGLTKWADR